MSEPKRVVPENILRLISAEDRKTLGLKTMDEIVAEKEFQLEKDLHNMFEAFLRRVGLKYYHAPMNQKSTHGNGRPDFGVFRDSRIIWIEFKAGKNRLSPEQKQEIGEMLADGNEVHVCYGYPEAVEVVNKFFDIKP